MRCALILLTATAHGALVPPPRASPVLAQPGRATRRYVSVAAAALCGLAYGIAPAWAEEAGEAVAAAPPEPPVMRGVMQLSKGETLALAQGSTAQVVMRVVGRNSKGPLATITVPLDGVTFPVDFVVTRSDLREGAPDYLWQEEDLYIIASVLSPAGKAVSVGRSKAKFKDGKHEVAYATLERQ